MRRLAELWRVLMEMTGDSDYARYCEHSRARHPESAPLSAREFYLARLKDKYARPNRCC
jgi:uncharacterized short protein YbdD (DUF466 family)